MRFSNTLLFAAVILLQAVAPLAAEEPIVESDRNHWSFRALPRPELPVVEDADWTRTPIDRFILYELEQRDLRPLRARG